MIGRWLDIVLMHFVHTDAYHTLYSLRAPFYGKCLDRANIFFALFEKIIKRKHVTRGTGLILSSSVQSCLLPNSWIWLEK